MCDVLFRDVARYADDWPAAAYGALADPSVSARMIETAYVAHFMMKSEADFVRRAERSVVGNYQSQPDWKARYDRGEHHRFLEPWNAVEDRYLKTYWERRLAGSFAASGNAG